MLVRACYKVESCTTLWTRLPLRAKFARVSATAPRVHSLSLSLSLSLSATFYFSILCFSCCSSTSSTPNNRSCLHAHPGLSRSRTSTYNSCGISTPSAKKGSKCSLRLQYRGRIRYKAPTFVWNAHSNLLRLYWTLLQYTFEQQKLSKCKNAGVERGLRCSEFAI